MIYDCFTFFNELDLLELRLEELKDVVDRFVLVEATKTFSNNPKPLVFKENRERFSSFNDRIIHIIVDDLPEQPKDSWENQYHQRNAISRGLVECTPDDIVIISDLDEIPRASAVATFQGEIAFLEQNLYYYRLNCLCTTAKWAIPIILRYRNLTTPQEVRMYWYNKERRNEIPTIPNGGWHFSYLGDIEYIQLKLNSFSQQDFNTPEVNNKEAIEKKIDLAEDLFGRSQYRWSYVHIDSTFPNAIYNNQFKYAKYIKHKPVEETFFDQFTRYKSCADILENLADEQATVLDVGCGTDCLLADFLPKRNITFVDPSLANLPQRPTYKIAGSAFAKELDGRSFDWAVSIDTLEHVPGIYRSAFIERLTGLATKGMVIAFPACDAGDAVETDAWINEVYKQAYGRDYCWLEEHKRHGLPSLQSTLEQLQSLGWRVSVLQNGHTPWMRELLSFTLCSLEVNGLKQKVLGLSKYFNEHLHRFDGAAPAYRQILIATKEHHDLPEPLAGDTINGIAIGHWRSLQQQMAAAPYAKIVQMEKDLQERTQHLAEQEMRLAQKEQQHREAIQRIETLQAQLTENQQKAADDVQKLVEIGNNLTGLNLKIASKDEEIAVLRETVSKITQGLAESGNHIATLEQDLHHRDERIIQLDQQLDQANQQLVQANQQLVQANQQLDQSNQQLDQSNQQLDQSNQQLDQSNQQLDQANQRINALNVELTTNAEERSNIKNELAEINQALLESQQELTDKNSRLETLTLELESAQKALTHLDQLYLNSKQRIANLEHDLENRIQDLTQAISDLGDKDSNLRQLNVSLESKIECIDVFNKLIAEKEEYINSLRMLITNNQEEIHNLEASLTSSDADVRRLNKTIKDNEDHIREIESQFSDQEQCLAKTSEELAEIKVRFEEILNSKSWRVTAPFRNMTDLLKNK